MENEKLFELMSKMYEEMQTEFGNIRGEMQSGFKEVNYKIDNITKDVSDLKDGQVRIEDKLDDLEVNNADRHITINRDVKQIKSTLSKVEIVTADNWSDIAKIKANKRHRAR